ncbi:MAG: hypothetical protein KatS3mg004_1771 [Bryobacteraceae bacterium]|nr:MAG: hypothetical protein KatS3mg004_1771 [Bryobacteraceae bacterium]
MQTCAYCGRKLPLLHRVTGGKRFCSAEHARLFHDNLRSALLDQSGVPEGEERAPQESSTTPAAPRPEEDFSANLGLLVGKSDPEPAAALPAEDAGAPLGGQDPFAALREELFRQTMNLSLDAAAEADDRAPAEDECPPSATGATFEAAAEGDPPDIFLPPAAPLVGTPPPAPCAPQPLMLHLMPARAPRRRIIVPTHRPQKEMPRMPWGSILPIQPQAVRPSLPGSGPVAFVPSSVGWSAGLPPLKFPGVPEPAPEMWAEAPAGLQPPVEWLSGPLCPSGQAAENRICPAPVPWIPSLPTLPSLPQCLRRNPGPAAAGAGRWSPAAAALPPARRATVDPAEWLMNGNIQPFRMHRLPLRAWRLPAATSALSPPAARWRPLPRQPLAECLYIPRAAVMPVRPSYYLGPPPATGNLSPERTVQPPARLPA